MTTMWASEQLVLCRDEDVGLSAVIAIDDTTLGPGLGGVRFKPYPSAEAAVTEARRLAAAMTRKNALADVPYGGAKSVIVDDGAMRDRPALMARFGEFVARTGGAYLPGVDMGTTVADLAIMRRAGAIVSCDEEDPSPWTALGVAAAIRAAVGDVEGISVLPSPAGHVGAALALATYPFVLFNPFHSEFWSHRTAVYFAFGVCLLVGVAFAALLQAGVALARRLPSAGTAAKGLAQPHRITPIAGLTGILLLAGLSGSVVAGTPGQYDGGWYRLYQPCEFAGLQAVAKLAQDNPNLLLITPDWQSKLVVSGLSDDRGRMWFKTDFYSSPQERDNVVKMAQEQGRPIVVVTDRLMPSDLDASFLHASPWTSVGTWCPGAGDGSSLPYVAAYTLER